MAKKTLSLTVTGELDLASGVIREVDKEGNVIAEIRFLDQLQEFDNKMITLTVKNNVLLGLDNEQ